MINLILFTILSPAILWVFFYLLFNVWADQTKAQSYSYLYIIVGFVGIMVDVYVNLWASALFMQLPASSRLLLSARLDDLILNGSGWRKYLAVFIVGTFIEPFDKTGQHTTYGQKP